MSKPAQTPLLASSGPLARVELSRSPWLHLCTGPFAVAAVLALFYAVLLLSVREKSVTFDEPGHAAAGYAYWKFGDYRLDPENGNLSKRWVALPLLFRSDRFPSTDSRSWQLANLWVLADEWFNRLENDPAAMRSAGRAMAALTALALAATVWFWSRALFGPLGGMLSLLVCVLSPTLLANGPLMTSDTPAALGFIVSLGCIWAVAQHITFTRVIAGTLAIAGLFLAKMSAALLLPMAFLLVIARVLDGRPLRLGRTVVLHSRIAQLGALAIVAVGQTLGVIALVWAAYGFRYPASPVDSTARFQKTWEWALGLPRPLEVLAQLSLSPEQQRQIERVSASRGQTPDWTYPILDDVGQLRAHVLRPTQAAKLHELLAAPPSHVIPRVIACARDHRLLPESFLYGYAHVWRTSDRLVAFFNGEIRDTGWLAFFPFAFAVKTPLALLALLAGSLVRAVIRIHRGRIWDTLYPVLPLLVLLVVYGAAALASHLNIGHRHLLPVYPPLFILTGFSAAWLATKVGRLVLAATLLALAAETAYRFPNYLAYFNGLVAPDRAYRHLIDSSLDWGQELPAISRYLQAHGGEKAHLAYFGVGSPRLHDIRAQSIGGFPDFDWKRQPPLHLLPRTSEEAVRAFLHANPDFDPNLVFRLEGGEGVSALVVQRAAALRLEPGLYLISASMLQPVYTGKVDTFWTDAHERDYRLLQRLLAPFFTDDVNATRAAISDRPVGEWISLMEDFYDFRLARLGTYLRTREPLETINHSILVYRLTAADISRALDGPLP